MQSLKRVLFAMLLIGINAVPFVSTAQAGWNIEEIYVDAYGRVIGAACDECLFWDCDCHPQEPSGPDEPPDQGEPPKVAD